MVQQRSLECATTIFYFQVGIIMLMGLLAKTAILLTEYASQNRREGMSIADSAFISAKMRLRPVLMTSLTMIFGMLPLMFANGVGANGSRTIGVCLVGGMLLGTLGLLLTVPGLFTIFQKLQEKFRKGNPEGRDINDSALRLSGDEKIARSGSPAAPAQDAS